MKLLLRQLRSFLPRRLPIGKSSFDGWVEDLVILSGLPNSDSTRKVAGLLIFQLPPTVGYISPRKISNRLIKAASNQVIHELFKEEKSGEQQQQLSQAQKEVV